MTKWILSAILTAFATLSICTAAVEARPFEDLEAQAYASAIEYWGGAEPIGCSTITKEVIPDAEAEGRFEGLATQTTPGAAPIPCTLQIVEEATAKPFYLCSVMDHEVGHLLGFGHSADPSSPMFPDAGNPSAANCIALLDTELLEERRMEHWQRWKEWQHECLRRPNTQRRLACYEGLRAWRERLVERYGQT